MTREMGKVLAETRGDVQEGIDTAYYAATEGRRLFGHVVPSELRSKWAMSYRRPIGVVGLITPFNFPLAIPTWKMFPALLCGNAVIIKPSEDVPHTVHLLVEILLEAGLPPEVIQLVHGRGETVGKALVEHPGRAGHLVHRLDRDRGQHRRDVRPHAQAAVARDGRQERDDRDGRRGSRSRARGRALGRVRHHGAALHRHEPAHPPPEDARPLPAPPDGRGGAARLGDGRADRTDVGPLIHAGRAGESGALRGDRAERGRRAGDRRQGARRAICRTAGFIVRRFSPA